MVGRVGLRGTWMVWIGRGCGVSLPRDTRWFKCWDCDGWVDGVYGLWRKEMHSKCSGVVGTMVRLGGVEGRGCAMRCDHSGEMLKRMNWDRADVMT